MTTPTPVDQTVATSPDQRHPNRHGAISGQPSQANDQWNAHDVAKRHIGREFVIDLVALTLLLCLAIYGFSTVFVGYQFMIAGAIGIVAGLAIATFCAQRRSSAVVVAALTLVAFFVLGTLAAVPNEGLFYAIPTSDSLAALLDGMIRGWKKLLTTMPPVGSSSLLVVPYVCGLTAAVLSGTIALRAKRAYLAPIPIIGLLAITILFGVEIPASVLIQGFLFSGLLLGWVAHRYRLSRLGLMNSARRRWAGAVAVLLLASLGGLVLGEFIHDQNERERVIWRHDPEFDPTQYPSPLNSFRRYVEPESTETAPNLGGWRDRTLFTVTGLPDGTPIRLATMDAFDGVVFRVTQGMGSDSGSAGYFQRVGTQISTGDEGETHRIKFEIHSYSNVWVPDVGELVSISFGGPNATELEEEFRYNQATGTAASRVLLQEGDTYEIEVRIPEKISKEELHQMVPGPSTVQEIQPVQQITDQVIDGQPLSWDQACEQVSAGASPVTRFTAAFECFRENGVFSNGPHVTPAVPSQSGHGNYRLRQLVTNHVPIGDEEQFAPLAALIANQFGLPVRVVMGFNPKGERSETQEVKGEDVSAWIELQLQMPDADPSEAIWVPIEETWPKRSELPPIDQSGGGTSQSNTPPPPPPTIPPEEEDEVTPDDSDCPDLGDLTVAEAREAGIEVDPACEQKGGRDNNTSALAWLIPVVGIASGPFLIIAAITGVIGGLKTMRRRRRQRRGTESRRMASSWDEVTDLAVDMGQPVSVQSTRQETARLIGSESLMGFAARTDQRIFGPNEVKEHTIDEQWSDFTVTRGMLLDQFSLFERWRFLVNPTSLRLGFARARAKRYNEKLARRVSRHTPSGKTVP